MKSVTVHHAEVATPNEVRAVLRDFLEDEDHINRLVKDFSVDLGRNSKVIFPLDNAPENRVTLALVKSVNTRKRNAA